MNSPSESHHEGESLIRGHNSSQSSAGSFMYAVRMASSVFGLTDKAHIAATKAASTDAGQPRQKHVDILISHITDNPNNLENILVAFNAATQWRKNLIVTCKLLMVLLNLLNCGCRIDKNCAELTKSFLDAILTHWEVRGNMFITLLVLNVKQRLIISSQHQEVVDCLNPLDNNYPENRDLHLVDVVGVLPRLLSFEDNLLAAMEVPLLMKGGSIHASRSETRLTAAVIETFMAAEKLLWTEAVTINRLISRILQGIEQYRVPLEIVHAFVRQYNDQFIGLTRIYEALKHHFDDLLRLPIINPIAES